MGYQDWKTLPKKEAKNKNVSNKPGNDVRLTWGPGEFRLRFVGKPYLYSKTFIPPEVTGLSKAICINVSQEEDLKPLTDLGYEAQDGFDSNAINRANKKVEVVRCPPSVWGPVVDYAIDGNVNPGGASGPDFKITVTDPNGVKRNRKYEVTTLPPAPFTVEEKAMLKNPESLHDLEALNEPMTVEKINELIEKFNITKVSNTGVDEALRNDQGSAEELEPLSEDETDDVPF